MSGWCKQNSLPVHILVCAPSVTAYASKQVSSQTESEDAHGIFMPTCVERACVFVHMFIDLSLICVKCVSLFSMCT